MNDRVLLGAADVSDERLRHLVADQLGRPSDDVVLLASRAEVSPYDIEALTTAGRYRVRGRARTPAGDQPFAFFVKVVQCWSRTEAFQLVPEPFRAQATELFPWWPEPAVYRTDLARRLPVGLRMPRAHAVVDIDELSAALWLEEVDVVHGAWTDDQFVKAAHLLGRLAASPAVRETVDPRRRADRSPLRGYYEGRLTHQVLPALREDTLWQHPLLAATFTADLRDRLRRAADHVEQVVAELEAMPVAVLHGDACPRNLLVPRDGDGFVLIDFGFWAEGPVGFDLGQLVTGEIQLGERPVADLPRLQEACLPAYQDGLRQEGLDVGIDQLWRAHALQLLLFTALSAIPFEHLGGPPTPETITLSGARATCAEHVLDLVDRTAVAPQYSALR
jgi:hypothetical protein